MKNLTLRIILFTVILLTAGCGNMIQRKVISPDGKLEIRILSDRVLENSGFPAFSLISGNRTVLTPSSIIIDFKSPSENTRFKIIKTETRPVSNSWNNPFGERKEIPDNFNETKLFLKRGTQYINLIYRAYNEGVAFAYEFPEQTGLDSVTINDENIVYRFVADYTTWSASRAQAMYSRVTLSKIEKGCERPLVIEYDSSLTVALAEAKMIDYSRMKFFPDSSGGISVRSGLDGPVKKAVPFQSPWRVVMVGRSPGDLLEKNYLLLNLNDPCEIEDISWIKPGKVLREVTLTTQGAKAAIDFTSSHGMQYVEFDAGWYGPENNDESDARSVNLDPARSKGPFDMKEVVAYANKNSIGILLYVNRKALEKQIDELLPIYKEWGIAGIKFGFVQVGSQEATRWLHESIEKVASYKMVVDVHDEYRPTGFQRTYPNLLTQEGIRGDEESPSNSHTLTTMFTRMIAGQGDNTICYYNERVDKKMGSHASQLAKSVCIFSPLQFIYWYDKAAPSLVKNDGVWGATNYIGNETELEFFNEVAVVWDETRVLYSEISRLGVIARKKGDEWFIGGINGDSPRNITIDFSFLDGGVRYQAKKYSDDPAFQSRTHVRTDTLELDSRTSLSVKLEANNGFAMHLWPVNR